MQAALRIYDGMIRGLAGVAAVILLAICAAIVLDVVVRNLGYQPPQGISALTEYGLLAATMAGAPWLVRSNGHVAVDTFVNMLPAAARRRVGQVVTAACVVLCLGLAWYALGMAVESHRRGDIDIRSIDMPRWIPFAAMAAGFLLLAVEFARAALARGPGPAPAGPRGSA